MPMLEEIENAEVRPETDNEDELGPGLSPTEMRDRVEHSRIAGEYYRDLATNYYDYEQANQLWQDTLGAQGHPWPTHPFPNEAYVRA